MAAIAVAPFLVAALLFFLPLLVLLLLSKNTRHAGTGHLPSPRGLPVLGHLHLLGALPHRTLRDLASVHGPVFLIRLGSVPTVVVSSAAGAEEAMKTRDAAFSSRPESPITDVLFYGTRDGAFTPHSHYWRQVRRIWVLHLLSPKKVNSFAGIRQNEADKLVADVRATAAADATVNVSKLLARLPNNVICRAALGGTYSVEEGGSGGGELVSLLNEFTTLLGARSVKEMIPWLGFVDGMRGLETSLRRMRGKMDAFLERVIEDHRRRKGSGGGGGDFVDLLLELSEHDKDVGAELNMDSIKAIVLAMFVAGSATTYNVMEWAMAELMRNPLQLQKLQEEVSAVVGGATIVTEEVVEHMSYLKAVIKETFRLHPPGPLLLPRETLEDTQLLGHPIPAKTRVFFNVWAIGRDPKTWPDRPEEFWPERFVDSSVDFRGQDFGLLPFGAGRRGCPGIGFACPNIGLVLASLLYHFEWELPNNAPPESLDMTENSGLSVHLKNNLVLVAKPRKP